MLFIFFIYTFSWVSHARYSNQCTRQTLIDIPALIIETSISDPRVTRSPNDVFSAKNRTLFVQKIPTCINS